MFVRFHSSTCFLVQLLTSKTDSLLEKFIKEKVAKLLVCIARLEWPGNWPGLIEDLIRMAERGNKEKEVVILSFKVMILMESSNIPDSSRRHYGVQFRFDSTKTKNSKQCPGNFCFKDFGVLAQGSE